MTWQKKSHQQRMVNKMGSVFQDRSWDCQWRPLTPFHVSQSPPWQRRVVGVHWGQSTPGDGWTRSWANTMSRPRSIGLLQMQFQHTVELLCYKHGSEKEPAQQNHNKLWNCYASSITLVRQLVFSAKMSRLQVAFALSAVQGLCVTTADKKPLPPMCKCQTWLHSHMDTSRSSAGGEEWAAGTTAKTVCAGWGSNLSGLPFYKHFQAKTCQTIYHEREQHLPQWPGGHRTFVVHYQLAVSWRSCHQHCGTSFDTWWEWGIRKAWAILIPLALH